MKTKWYIGAFVIAFIFLGICNHQISAPNQEVSIQFNAEEATPEQSQIAIDAITQELQALGVYRVHVRQSGKGALRISYHSSVAVEFIKNALSKKIHLGGVSVEDRGESSKQPSKKQGKPYQLDVYEIHKTHDGTHSTGKFVVIVKQDYDRYLNTNFYPSHPQVEIVSQADAENTSNKIGKSLAIAKDPGAHVIPEVRAGPEAPSYS